jgi:hypothetical protein
MTTLERVESVLNERPLTVEQARQRLTMALSMFGSDYRDAKTSQPNTMRVTINRIRTAQVLLKELENGHA